MKLVLFTIVATMFTLSATSHAAGKSMLSRGGLGFLFPDHNSFSNPGQFSLDKGTGIEGTYATQSTDSGSATAMGGSVVYGSGSFGIGAYGNRVGVAGFDVDSAGAGLGFAMAKGRLTLGLSMSRVMTTEFQTNDGTVGVGLTWNGAKREGLSLGVGATTTLNDAVADTRGATAALGYGFKSGYSFEVDFALPNIDDSTAYTVAGYLNMAGKFLYFSGGAKHDAAAQTQTGEGRLGFVLGNAFDVSGTVTYPFQTGGDPTFGGTARLAF